MKSPCPGSGLAEGLVLHGLSGDIQGLEGANPLVLDSPVGVAMGFEWGNMHHPPVVPHTRPQALAHQRQPVPNGNEKPSALRPSFAEGRTLCRRPADTVRGIQLQGPGVCQAFQGAGRWS